VTTLRRPKPGWDGIIKIYLKYIGWEVMDCSNMAQDSGSGWFL
jgi:hypothetical protein